MVTMEAMPSPVDSEQKPLTSSGPSIALISSYTGGNLGDAAIQDSMISNLRQRLPAAEFLGITLNCDNFIERHGTKAYPLLPPKHDRHSSGRIVPSSDQQPGGSQPKAIVRSARRGNRLIQGAKKIPGLVRFAKLVRSLLARTRREVGHSLGAYRILRTQDLLVISGGGQLDEEHGGPWRLPYTIFKWILIARLARVPCAIVSVGAGRLESKVSRIFFSAALRLSAFRSFRESRSKQIAEKLFAGVKTDPVVPDLAFSVPDSELSAPNAGIRMISRGRHVVAVAPISYAKPINWPTSDNRVYQRYIEQMTQVLVRLLEKDYVVVVVCSSLGDDETVIPDLMSRFEQKAGNAERDRIYFPRATNWREFVAVLRDTDCLIASRLHATILGVVAHTPTVAISFDRKVDWVMEDLQLTKYLLHIRDFKADDVMRALVDLFSNRSTTVEQIKAYRRSTLSHSSSAEQFDSLARLANEHSIARCHGV